MKKIVCFIAVVAAILFSQSAFAITVDLWSDFPNAQGDNGFYAYAYNMGTSTKTLMSNPVPRGFNNDGYNYALPYLHGFASSWIYTHPSNNEDSLLGWVVPETNTYDISGTVEACDWGHIYAYIKDGDTTLTGVDLNASYDGVASANFDLEDQIFHAGDMLYFGINCAGNQGNDTSRFLGQIEYTPNQAVPEPATMSLLGLGLAGLLKFRKKKLS